MKPIISRTARLQFLFLIPVLLGTAWARSEESICARVEKHDRGFQVILPTGKIQKTISDTDLAIPCGSTVSTLQAPATLELVSGVRLQLGKGSYLDVNPEHLLVLYTGRILLQGPKVQHPVQVLTSYSRLKFSGGMAVADVNDARKEASVSMFNGTSVFENRFDASAQQSVRVGEMSTISLSDPRLVPRQPSVMDPSAIALAMEGLGVTAAERGEMVAAVQRVVDSKSKSLSMEIENWKRISKPQEEGRSLASESRKEKTVVMGEPIEAIQEREAVAVMKKFRKRIYGPTDTADDETNVASLGRGPASVKSSPTEEKDFSVIDRANEKQRKRAVQEVLDQISADE